MLNILKVIALLCAIAMYIPVIAQQNNSNTNNENSDTLTIKNLQEVIISATRYPSVFRLNSMATSLVTGNVLGGMQKSIAADEALRLVPGVRIDNQAEGSRLHMSIRGQGILSERGLRGIKVLIDGIPVNDPTGFAPDLYDVDWLTVNRIEVLRGPAASFYGGGGAAGVLNIKTNDGGQKKAGGVFYASAGSNGFMKGFGQVDGSLDNMNYRVSFSKMKGNAYRDHAAYWANNLSEKINVKLSNKVQLSQVLMLTDYFNQNAEGLSFSQNEENPEQANPDANPFNEYQKTNRITNGLTSKIALSEKQDIELSGFIRWWKYKETSNRAAQYRTYTTPGGSAQYNLHAGNEQWKNHVSVGADFQWQTIAEYKLKSLSNPGRVESTSEVNIEDTLLLANQIFDQNCIGAFISDKFDFGKNLSINASLRYDKIYNKLNDMKNLSYNMSGSATFEKVTGRVGAAYTMHPMATVFANFATGFLPPATEELCSNPVDFAGFNKGLKPSTSTSEEFGLRGNFDEKFFYDVTAFYMTTENDFYRYKIYPARGNQEVFYGNLGDTRRYGVELFVSCAPIKPLHVQLAYTYSNFTYASDSLKGQAIPQSPEHQVNAEVEYKFLKNFTIAASTDFQTDWLIYTDLVHNNVKQNGFNTYHARLSYKWNLMKLNGELSVFAKNLTDVKYVAFTEPDPDGNCYQPAARRQFFASLKVNF